MFIKERRSWIARCIGGSLLLALVIGCGGSGGGGNNFEGNREAARVTPDNAQVMALAAYDSATLEGPFGSVASLTDATESAIVPNGQPTLLTVAQVLTDALKAAEATQGDLGPSARAIELENLVIQGSCGGEASFSIQIDETSGVFSGDFNFNNYCAEDTILDGATIFEGRRDPATNELESFTFSFSALSGSSDGDSFLLDGSLTIRMNATRDVSNISMDLFFQITDSDETLWLNGFTLSVTDNDAYDSIEFGGRFYHPVHGFVDLTTDAAFRKDDSSDYPSEGILRLTGADNGEIRMTVLSDIQYQLEVDSDGDGEFEWGPTVYDWVSDP